MGGKRVSCPDIRRQFRSFMPAVAHRYRLVAPDYPGFGVGPKYRTIQEYWGAPTPEARAVLEEAVTEEGLREEVLGEVPQRMADRISPDIWTLAWAQMTPERRHVYVDLMGDIRSSVDLFPEYQAFLREHQPPTLIVWGPNDGYMPEGAAKAYLRDLPAAELHLLEGGGHWLLETHLERVVTLTRDFLERVTGIEPA